MPRRQRILMVILFIGIMLGTQMAARAEGDVQMEPTRVNYSMGSQISFESRVLSEIPVEEVWVFVHPQAGLNTFTGMATLHPSNGVTYSLELSAHPIPAYSTVEFWYEVKLEDGQSITTKPETFIYADNRFEWQTLTAPPFEAAWYEGDPAFGQQMLNFAQQGMAKLQGYLPVPPPMNVKIYSYASATELQTALRLAGQTGAWIAGHADPALGTVVVTLPPGPAQTYESKRQIPHEVAHVALYQWLGPDYYNLPQWLREGLPTMAELFPNPDYPVLLDNAYENEALLPMAMLCADFPLEASSFLLAYAQASDFTWFVYDNYGSSGLEALTQAYADGLSCEQGAQQALGKSLAELEREWRRQTFGENTFLSVLQELLPWLVLMGVVLLAPGIMLFSRRQKHTDSQ